MTIRLYKGYFLLSSTTMHPFLPHHAISEQWLEEYMIQNPFPETDDLKADDIFSDFVMTDVGMLYFFDLNEEQIKWIEECCNSMLPF